MADKDSVGNTIKVTLLLCIVCSVFVSAAAVLLRPAQQANKDLDRKTNILAAAGLLKPGISIDEQFASVTSRAIDLDTGKFTEAVDVAVYDQRKASKDPALSEQLSREVDIAKISRRIKYATVYLIEGDQGIEKVILPIKGSGLWSTLYGFLALDADLNTVAGIGFYEHAETPGLGGEVDNPLWKAKWVGKRVYGDDTGVALGVIKGKVDTSRAGSEHQVDGLSGATLTSKGVDNLIQFWLGENGYEPFLANLKDGEA
ncbi:MAG: Na(+)-translocating NADH-quinone reductase subunit C [Gammaproteobacteria bacterium]|nr:MAG: Na(+)-translocating NADH-quinone reductase subunit C [Gammaproteobacteria bacterium]RLA53666.1 MAG: Na(+)-translocating NADH-quinone reductase subunit C [Gammaproteobacteria bacterium]